MVAQSLGPAQADAGELDGYLTIDDVLPGACSPETVLDGQFVDCRFPLARPGQLDPYFGPHVADQDIEFDDANEDQADCVVEARELVCRGLNAYYSTGNRSVRVLISGELSPYLASFEAVDWSTHGVNFTPTYGREPYVIEGDRLEVWVESSVNVDTAFARVTDRDGGEVLHTVEVGAVQRDEYEIVEIDLGSLPPGRYRVTPCLGDTAESCVPVPGGQLFQVGTGELLEVVPGWNRPLADRINIVFAPSGFDSVKDALEMARQLLTWDGPWVLGFDGRPVSDETPLELIAAIQFGPFSIEPLDSSRYRFNIWLLDDLVGDPRALVHSAPPFGFGPPAPDFGLPDVAVTSLHLNPVGRFGRSEAGWTSFTSPNGPTAISRDDLEFAGAYLSLPREWALVEATTLAHEWGHSLFDLRDEYTEPERGVTHGYPNCAPDQSTAEDWWGDLEGEVDPFVYEYLAALERSSLWVDPFFTDRVRVGYEVSGCYSDGDDAVRPTADSIMNSTAMPVFGSVNRTRVEEILALWNGREALTDPADLAMSCQPVTRGTASAACGAEIRAMVDVPDEGLVLVVDGGSALPCSIVAGGVSALTMVECPETPLGGPGPWLVAMETPSGSVSVEIELATPPVPTTTTTTAPEPEPAPSSRSVPIWPLAVGGLGVIALIAVTTIRRARRVTPLG